LPGLLQAERSKAEVLARRWLGEEAVESFPLVDARGRKLRLVLDRFTISDPEAIRQVRALGKNAGEKVLFFDGADWIGEADFSMAGQMLLITPQQEHGDRLLALFRPIPGLAHAERQVDDLDPLDGAPRGSGGAGLLAFKNSFFAAWLDEPNQKLDQATPRQAALDGELRPRLVRLLADLEGKEARLPKAERFSFAALRKELGLA
jgi:hypothetical protein